jgi:hypothetical protein
VADVTVAGPEAHGVAPGEKGLKGNALGMISSIVIGVASTAPGYSLAASARRGDPSRDAHVVGADSRPRRPNCGVLSGVSD